MLLLLLEAAAEAPDPRDAEGLGMEAMVRFVVVLLLFSFLPSYVAYAPSIHAGPTSAAS